MAWGACWWASYECGVFGDMVRVAALVLVLRVIEVCCGSGDVVDPVGLCVCMMLFL
jgi:hypothetical protein